MPVEIKELHIRMEVNMPPTGQTAGGLTAGSGGNTGGGNEGAKEALVAECIEQVLQILQNKTER
jgi:hypothetical protein